jgi:hypothetical protein
MTCALQVPVAVGKAQWFVIEEAEQGRCLSSGPGGHRSLLSSPLLLSGSCFDQHEPETHNAASEKFSASPLHAALGRALAAGLLGLGSLPAAVPRRLSTPGIEIQKAAGLDLAEIHQGSCPLTESPQAPLLPTRARANKNLPVPAAAAPGASERPGR